MRYSRVSVDAIGYELAPVVVSTAELEARLQPLYEQLRLPPGQLEALTGIAERRWWEEGSLRVGHRQDDVVAIRGERTGVPVAGEAPHSAAGRRPLDGPGGRTPGGQARRDH